MKFKHLMMAGMSAALIAVAAPAGAQQVAPPSPAANAQPPMPTKTTRTGKHVNRIIDMWLKNQPVYYAQISGGGYEEGKRLATTKADIRLHPDSGILLVRVPTGHLSDQAQTLAACVFPSAK